MAGRVTRRRAVPSPVAAGLLIALLLTFAGATTHAAAAAVEKAIWGPTMMPDGSSAFPVYQQLGVDVYQVQLIWSDTATERPAAPTNSSGRGFSASRRMASATSSGGRSGVIALTARPV